MKNAELLIQTELRRNSEKCGVRLSETLEIHLVLTTSRYLNEGLESALLTVRLVRAGDERRAPGVFRKIGDDCLVTCALFPEVIKRQGGSLAHYAGVGRAAYDSAGLTEAAYGFGLMLDVLSVFRDAADPLHDLMDRARAGSKVAQHKLSDSVVVPFVGRPRVGF